MAEECSHDCSSCSANCSSRQETPEDFRAALSPNSSVKKVIGVVSGKGGVGKSLVTTMLAVKTRARGFKVGILDADITGPSIPKAFGLTGGIGESPDGLMLPATTNSGIEVMSSNLLLENDTDPVIWRGPMIANAVKQFWTDTLWEDIDYMYVDMPPGTGDVPLTVFQSIPLDGIIIVTSPQELVSMIVEKAVNMAQQMKVPIIGIIENMSYFECPDCGARHSVFGPSHIDEIAAQTGIPLLAKIPINPATAKCVDSGTAEFMDAPWIEDAVKAVTGEPLPVKPGPDAI